MFERRENVTLARIVRSGPGATASVRQLERHLPLLGAVRAAREPDLAHAAAAELAHEFVRADAVPRRHLPRERSWRASLNAAGGQQQRRRRIRPLPHPRQCRHERRVSEGSASSHAPRASASRPSASSSSRLTAAARRPTTPMLSRRRRAASRLNHSWPWHFQCESAQRDFQQQSRLVPVAPHGAFGQFERLGDLGFGVAAEVTHLDHPRQPWLGLGQHDRGPR